MHKLLNSGLAATALTAAALATAMLAAPAAAQTGGASNDPRAREVAMEVVYYSDLDLATAQGQRVLRSRLRDAARYVCGMDVRSAGRRFPSNHAQLCYAEQRAWIDREVAARSARLARRD